MFTLRNPSLISVLFLQRDTKPKKDDTQGMFCLSVFVEKLHCKQAEELLAVAAGWPFTIPD